MARAIHRPEEPIKKDNLDSIAKKAGTIVMEQHPRPSLDREVLKTDSPIADRKREFMSEIAMRHG